MQVSVHISSFKRHIIKRITNSCIPPGPKSNYAYHTEAMDRAMQGGIDDVGMGVLFGLNTYRYDFVGLLMHAEHLEAVYGRGTAYHKRSPHLLGR